MQQNIIMIKPIYFGVDPTESFLAYFISGFFERYSKRKCQSAACLVFGEKETPPLLITTVCRLFTSLSLETGFKNHPLSLEEGDILLVHGTLMPRGGGGGRCRRFKKPSPKKPSFLRGHPRSSKVELFAEKGQYPGVERPTYRSSGTPTMYLLNLLRDG